MEGQSRAWAGLDAARRRLVVRRRFWPVGSWACVRAWRRDLVARSWLAFWIVLTYAVALVLWIDAVFSPARSIGGGGAGASALTAEILRIAALVGCLVLGVLLVVRWKQPERARDVLERRRVRMADRLAAGMEGLHCPTSEAVDHMRALREFWGKDSLSLAVLWRGLSATSPTHTALQSVSLGVVFVAQTLPPILTRPVGLGVSPAFTMPAFIVSVWAAVFLAQRPIRQVRTRIRATLNARQCPDCGYDLESLTESGDAAIQLLGPTACPECGVRWPLVPPMPVDERGWRGRGGVRSPRMGL